MAIPIHAPASMSATIYQKPKGDPTNGVEFAPMENKVAKSVRVKITIEKTVSVRIISFNRKEMSVVCVWCRPSMAKLYVSRLSQISRQ